MAVTAIAMFDAHGQRRFNIGIASFYLLPLRTDENQP
jgi:hypothetical protein